MTNNPRQFLSRTGYREVSAASAAVLDPGNTINGVLFTGASPITVTAAAGTLTGNTLNSTVINSSLTLLGSSASLPGSPTTTTQSPSDNSTKIATTAYADSAVSTALTSVFKFKGVIDASGNPNYPAAAIGDTYRISVAGKIGGASGIDVTINDTVYCFIANGGGTQAAVGADFVIIHEDETGEVIGPSSAVSGNVVLFDGTTGKLIKDSGLTLSPYDVTSDVTTTTGGLQITNIMSISAAAYALITPDSSTLYFIT